MLPSLPSAESWLGAAALKVAGAFLTTFLGAVVTSGGGVLHLSTIHAAAVAGVGAGVAALDTVVGNVLHRQSTSIVGALRSRAAG